MLSMKESEIPKYLAEELSKEPYNLNLNLISFTSLQGDALMKVFQSVLIDIHPKLKDMLAETSDTEKVEQMMELLRILKFWPKCFDQQTLKRAMEAINQEIIWDTMGWLLTRKDELKKRAYLSMFLVKVAIPDEFMFGDPETQRCYEQYEQKIVEFKNIHKKLEEIKKHKGISDLVNDLKAVEREIDSCSRKLDMMKCNVGNIPAKQDHLQLAEDIRHARAEKSRLRNQLYVEERKLWCLEKKTYFMSNKLHEIQELNTHSSPEGLLERTEQDCEILRFIVQHKIPQDIEEAERKIRALKMVITVGPEYPSDLEGIRKKIFQVQKETQNLELNIKLKDTDASLSFARQKASENKKRKLELLEELEEIRKDMLDNQNILREKREARKQLFPDGIPCLSNRDFKEYVKTMKVKAAKYKAMRAEISTIQAEIGIMSTTNYVVEEELKDSTAKLKQIEKDLGFEECSFFQGHVDEEQIILDHRDESKLRYIYKLCETGRELQESLTARRAVVKPLSEGVIQTKQEIKTLELHCKRLNTAFDAEMGPILESIRRFETRISKAEEEIIKTQEEICQKTAQYPVLKANVQRARIEAELLKDNPTTLRSFKNRILTRVVDQERLQKVLNQDMSQLEQTQTFDMKQNVQWLALKRLLEMKKQMLLNVAEEDKSD